MRFTIFLPSVCLFLSVALLAHSESVSSEERRHVYLRRIGDPTTIDGILQTAAKIDIDGPIGEYEAYVLASAYCIVYASSCGGPELPKEHGDRWIASTMIGYISRPGPEIIVEKAKGATYSPGRQKISDPKEYLKYIQKS